MTEVVMPRLSDSMEEGTILKWLKSDGDSVKRGESLAEIETDKASMTYESDSDGVLKIVAPEGATLPVGATIAQLSEHSQALNQGSESQQPLENAVRHESQPSDTTDVSRSDGEQPFTHRDGGEIQGPGHEERVKASPLARRIGAEEGVELASLKGSGPGGRVVKADVEEALAHNQPVAAADKDQMETAKGRVELVELSRAQQTIARKMAESRATIPEFSLRVEVDMERAVDLRKQLKQGIVASDAIPSFNDLFVKACALALAQFPRVNGAYRDGRFELYSRVNVGVAVAGSDGTLSVPTVFDADHKSLEEIAKETVKLAERVRSGAITPPELAGGTFTVSNLGMFGIKSFNAVINQPQAAILAVGSVQQRPAVYEGELALRYLTEIELSCDHRIVYGAEAAEFLATVRKLLEAPSVLLPDF